MGSAEVFRMSALKYIYRIPFIVPSPQKFKFTMRGGVLFLSLMSSLWALAVAAIDIDSILLESRNPRVARNQLSKRGQYGLYKSDYCFDANLASNPNWMSHIRGNTPISLISLPGTHDTAAWPETLTSSGLQCQNNNLQTQLNAGIRFLDMRAMLAGADLIMCNGPVPTGSTFPQLLNTVLDFLDRNPSEAIIMRVREEQSPPAGTQGTFSQKFQQYLAGQGSPLSGINRFPQRYYDPHVSGHTEIPTLDALRGKILILQDFNSGPYRYGVVWKGANQRVEDVDYVSSVETVRATKYPPTVANLEAAIQDQSGNRYYITHLSASGSSASTLPIMVAAGLSLKIPFTPPESYVGMNELIGKYIEAKDATGNTNLGIVIMDFPGARIINRVLQFNAHLRM